MSSIFVSSPDKLYLFVTDTDSYAGNFEREMCAYMTGRVGDCEVGEEEAEIAKKEIPEKLSRFEKLIAYVPDEHGCCRPATIFPNPRYGNDGIGNYALLTKQNRHKFKFPAYTSVGIYFCEKPDSELLGVLKKRAKSYASKKELRFDKNKIKIEGFRLLEQKITFNLIE